MKLSLALVEAPLERSTLPRARCAPPVPEVFEGEPTLVLDRAVLSSLLFADVEEEGGGLSWRTVKELAGE